MGARGKSARPRAYCNFTARRDETLADDLDARVGGVNAGVALLLRRVEPNPTSPVLFKTPPSIRG